MKLKVATHGELQENTSKPPMPVAIISDLQWLSSLYTTKVITCSLQGDIIEHVEQYIVQSTAFEALPPNIKQVDYRHMITLNITLFTLIDIGKFKKRI